MIMLDNTVVNVALPSMRRSLGLSLSQLEWIVAGYALTFAAFMLTGGKLADLLRPPPDLHGRARRLHRRLARLRSRDQRWLPDRRARRAGPRRRDDEPGDAVDHRRDVPAEGARQGDRHLGRRLGHGARDRPARRRLLTEHVNWNWIFFINVPIGIAGLLAIPFLIDESRDTSREQRPDVPGLVDSAVGLFALTYAFIEANNVRLDVDADPRLVRGRRVADRRLRAARAPAAPADARPLALPQPHVQRRERGDALRRLAMFGTFFYVSLYMQNVLGYSPVQSGASFLPMTCLIILIAPRAGKLSDRFGSRWLVGGGMTLLAIMLFYFSRLGEHATFWTLLPGLLIGGTGMALTMTPTTAAAMSSVPVDKAGVGSAVLNSMRQVGGSLGIAVMGAVVASASASSLAAGDDPRLAFLHGFHDALRIASVLALAGAIVATAMIRKPVHHHAVEAPVAAVEAA
jgi:MFS family permease